MANTEVRSRDNNMFRKRVTMLSARISYADLGARDANDRVECFLIPAGAVISRYWLDVHTAGAGTVDLGTSASPTGLKADEDITTAQTNTVNTATEEVTGNQPYGVKFDSAQTRAAQYDFTFYVELIEPESTVGLPLETPSAFNAANSGNS